QSPVVVRRLLRKCLEKDPKNRLRDIGDVWELLKEPTVEHPQPERRDATAPWIMASVLGIIALVFSVLWLKPLPLPDVVRFQIQAPPGGRLRLGTPAISNDGRKLAYMVVDPDGLTRIYLRAIDDVESRALPGTEGAVHPFWSPDGGSVAFAAGPDLKRIDLAGGAVRGFIGGLNAGGQGGWNQKEDILFDLRGGRSLRYFATGGA